MIDPKQFVELAAGIHSEISLEGATLLLAYLDAMLAENENVNLTAVREREAAVTSSGQRQEETKKRLREQEELVTKLQYQLAQVSAHVTKLQYHVYVCCVHVPHAYSWLFLDRGGQARAGQ